MFENDVDICLTLIKMTPERRQVSENAFLEKSAKFYTKQRNVIFRVFSVFTGLCFVSYAIYGLQYDFNVTLLVLFIFVLLLVSTYFIYKFYSQQIYSKYGNFVSKFSRRQTTITYW